MKGFDSFKQAYYVLNIPWQRNLDTGSIPKFKDLKYNDVIIFHFDVWYSVFKAGGASFTGFDKSNFVAILNACLRYYQIIKKIYPYNKLRVVIHLKNQKLVLDYDTFKSVIDILPNFAVCKDTKELEYFDSESYKHIIYGSCNNHIPKNTEYQKWSVIKGNLIVLNQGGYSK